MCSTVSYTTSNTHRAILGSSGKHILTKIRKCPIGNTWSMGMQHPCAVWRYVLARFTKRHDTERTTVCPIKVISGHIQLTFNGTLITYCRTILPLPIFDWLEWGLHCPIVWRYWSAAQSTNPGKVWASQLEWLEMGEGNDVFTSVLAILPTTLRNLLVFWKRLLMAQSERKIDLHTEWTMSEPKKSQIWLSGAELRWSDF